MAHRKIGDIYRGGKPSIAEAIREGVACWAFEEELVLRMRAEGVTHIGVLVKETGDRFLTALTNLFDPSQTKTMDHSGRSALQRYLPLQFFNRRPGKIVKRR